MSSLLDKYKNLSERTNTLNIEFNQLKGQLDAFRDEIKSLENDKEKLDEEIVDYNDISDIFRQLSVELKSDLKDLIEGLTTKALQSIWQDKEIEFKLKFEEKRNQIETNFVIQEGEYKSENILQENGGGVADVVSFMIRIVIHQFYTPDLPNILILDEPFKHVSGEDYLNRLGEFIKELSREMDFQFFINSHQQSLIEYSDKVFELDLHQENGVDTSEVQIVKGNDDNDS